MTGALALGPVQFNWPAEQWRDFYLRIADEAPIDTVYLGEVVCAKRAPFFQPHLAEVAERLAAGGKEVVHSTLALVMTEAEMDLVRELVADETLLVEANDLSTISLLAGRRHVVGPFVNVYNEGTLVYLAARGALRVSLPAELSGEAIALIAEAVRDLDVELEVQVFGRLPLAVSARCYHARAFGLHKDGCQFVCGEDLDGLAADTLDGEAFLAINGTQVMSHSCCNLADDIAGLCDAGVGRFRLWPHSFDMVAVARVYRELLDGELEVAAADDRLNAIAGGLAMANGFYHGQEGRAWVGPAA